MPEIEETTLPGVGLRYEFTTRAGEHIGVVSHRTGRRDLLVYSAGDPDACRAAIALTVDESTALAELLGGTRVTTRLGELQQRVEGLAIDWVPVPPRSPFAGRTIAAAGVRSVTGVSIVAVLRSGNAFPAPRPDFALQAGDVTRRRRHLGRNRGVCRVAGKLTRGLDVPLVPSAARLVELGTVLFGLGVLGRVAGYYGFSPVPLYLVAG